MTNLNILFEDENLIAVDKPSGLLIHPHPQLKNVKENLMMQVRDHLNHYVYPIHRLDRSVSGVVLFGKNSEIVPLVQDKWNTEQTKKYYLGLTKGVIESPGIFDFALQDENKVKKDSKTSYWPLLNFEFNTLVKIQIHTGRHHQIRRHFSRRMHQIIGDTAHGKGKTNRMFREHYALHRIFLHSYKLIFPHPLTMERMQVTTELPSELCSVLDKLRLNLRFE